MNILVLTRYDRKGASSRLRFYQYLPYLRAKDIQYTVSPFFGKDYIDNLYSSESRNKVQVLWSYIKRIKVLIKIYKYDLVWVEKELFPSFPAIFEKLLQILNVKLVVDYDDAVFHNYDRGKGIVKKLLSKKIDRVMKSASLVMCGNNYIADRAKRAEANNIIFPTVIDVDKYQYDSNVKNEILIIGWIGTANTLRYLVDLKSVFENLSKKIEFQLNIIGAEWNNPSFKILEIPWQESNEVSEIQKFDIGIMPLRNSPWEKGKCGYKLIQYMGCGKPVVGTPIGVNDEIIIDGFNGFKANSEDEWVNAITKLAEDFETRKRMGSKGRKLVESRFSLQSAASTLISEFEKLVK